MGQLRLVCCAAFAYLALLAHGCAGCSEAPAGHGDADGGPIVGACESSDECLLNEECRGGVCVTKIPGVGGDGGPGDGGGTSGDGGTGDDAGPVGVGLLTALPDTFVELGAQRIGVPVQKTVTLVNVGTAPLTVLQVFLDDNPTGEFQATPTGSLNQLMEPGDQLPILVTHTPVDGTSDSASIKVVHTANTEELFTVELLAEFKGTARVSLSADPLVLDPDVTLLDLGDVPLGAQQSTTLYVRNDGSSDSVLTLSSVTVTPGNAGFSIGHPALSSAVLSRFEALCTTVDDCPESAAACEGGVCLDDAGAILDTFPITVTFDSASTGLREASLSVAHDALGATTVADVALVATGVAGNLLASPGSVDFAGAFVGRSYERTVTVSNMGGATTIVEGLELAAGAPFELTHALTFPHAVAPTESFDVTVRYVPTAEGANDDVLTVLSDQMEDLAVALSGAARLEPEIDVDDTLDFGGVYGGTSRALPVTVRNLGPGVLSVSDLTITGTNADKYSLSLPTLPAEILPLADPNDDEPRLVVNVTYQPDASPNGVPDDATLVIASDDPDVPSAEVALTGQSIKPVVFVSPALVDFGLVFPGESAPTQAVEVRNNGVGPLYVTAASLAGDGDFTVTPSTALPAEVLLGEVLTLTIGFTPSTTGTRTGTLTIASTDAASPSVQVQLLGSGRTCDLLPGTTVTQNGATCTYTCDASHVDLDGDLNTAGSNGCEYACSIVSEIDLPDDAFLDANCDGIDGDVSTSIFVDGTFGDDGNPGTMDAPKKTLAAAIAAQSAGGDVLVSVGTYTGSLSLKDGVSISGGYDASDGWARDESNVATIAGGTTAIQAVNIVNPTVLSHLNIVASGNNTAGGSSIGVYASSSDGLELRFVNVTAGDGGNGANGGPGQDGDDATAGAPGQQGCDGCSGQGYGGAGGSGCYSGGSGGRGGHSDSPDGQNGAAGGGPNRGAGGSGGDSNGSDLCAFGCSDGDIGGNGGPGASGGAGTNGAGGAGGSVVGGLWVPANGETGTAGSHGSGGGGGGGGGGTDCCLDDRGGGGGGGGGGGCRGLGGQGGGGGGGSFAVFLHASNVQIIDSHLASGQGGDGGDGGEGGTGGSGGAPGSAGAAADNGARGGAGGRGGDGGRGGHGGGGAGGVSYGVYLASGATATLTRTDVDPGEGGAGGRGPGIWGTAGVAASNN